MSSTMRSCYSRDGTRITDVAYQPCSNDTTRDAACCGTNHSGAGHDGIADDLCESNGLCQNFDGAVSSQAQGKLWWRQGCTDPTWQSEFCLSQVCNFDPWKNDNAPVRSCGNGRWCCGDPSCCGVTSSLFELPATVGATPIASSSSISSAATTTGSLTASETISTSSRSTFSTSSPSAPQESAEGGLSAGAKAGIGAGAAVVVILVAIIALLALKLKNRKSAQQSSYTNGSDDGVQEKPNTTIYVHQAHTPPTEMPAHTRLAELDSGLHAELPGDKLLKYGR